MIILRLSGQEPTSSRLNTPKLSSDTGLGLNPCLLHTFSNLIVMLAETLLLKKEKVNLPVCARRQMPFHNRYHAGSFCSWKVSEQIMLCANYVQIHFWLCYWAIAHFTECSFPALLFPPSPPSLFPPSSSSGDCAACSPARSVDRWIKAIIYWNTDIVRGRI